MRLTKALFYLSDTFAWLLASFAALVAVSFPFLGPISAKMDHETISPIEITVITLLWAVVAIGAWHLTRRKLWGLVAVALPALYGSLGFKLIYLGLVALVFGTPLLLAFFEARNRAVRESET